MEKFGTFTVRSGLAEMLKGGVIMDVTNPGAGQNSRRRRGCIGNGPGKGAGGHSRPGWCRPDDGPRHHREDHGGCDHSRHGESENRPFCGSPDPRSRLDIDFIDESEVLTPADDKFHVNKWNFKVPFVCGAINLGEALRRIGEGAAMIRTKGEAGTGNVIEAVRHMRTINDEIAQLTVLPEEELMTSAKNLGAPYELVRMVAKDKKLPVVNFSAGGLATPADAAMMMQLGADGVFVGSGIFKSADPAKRAHAIVQAVTHFNNPDILVKVSKSLGEAMPGLEISDIEKNDLLQFRGN